ncbi:MAG: anthranilate synthase component I family protein [Acidimicrobiia bacterium]
MGSGPAVELERVPTSSPEVVLAALGGADAVAVRDGARTVVAADPIETVVASGDDALTALGRLTPGWWAGFLAYDLGRSIERVVPRTAPTSHPDLVLARFDARLVLDPGGSVRIDGDPESEAAVRLRAAYASAPDIPRIKRPDLGRWWSSLDRDAFADRVRVIRELLVAGECYQVNLTRRLTCDRPADPVALFAALAVDNPAPYGALIRLAGVSLVSASPECFLRWRGPVVETRPIKGTAPTEAALEASVKDRAENVMIVDLARNDLGRVSVPGSIQVPELFRIEEHPGLFHLVSTVRARRRVDVGPAELLRATFPPASVTGAPKPRVLQAIEDLEPVRRWAYCGALGWIDTERDAGDLAVAIRTFTITGAGSDAGETTLGVGAGIVADSDPLGEWAETELKAARLLRAAGVDA